MIKWLLKKSIWATEARKWHGMSHDDESDVLHTFSSSCSSWLGPHLFLGIFILFSGALLGGSRFPQGGTKVKELNYYIILLCHGDTQRDLIKHSLDPPCAFIYFLLSGLPFLGGLVHFDKLWLYWSMYCMLSSSQPLIRTFHLLILATRFESG